MKQGWEVKKIQDITKVINGYAFPSKDFESTNSIKSIKSIKITNVGVKKFVEEKDNYLPEKYKSTLQDYKVKEGNIVIALTRTIIAAGLKVAVVPYSYDGAFLNQRVAALIPNEKLINQRYLYNYLTTDDVEKYVLANVNTLMQPNLSINDLRNLLIPLPPLPEQKRIVAILDEAFAGINLAVANAEKNLANARELFESYLNNVFTQKGDGWEEKLLSSTCIVERGSSPRPIKQFLTDDADGVNWIKIGDTKGVVKSIRSTKQRITKEGAKRSRAVNPGDFILTNSMSYGKPYIMETSGCIHDGWFVLRLAENINTDFFYYLLSSRLVQDQFSSLAAGAIVKNISGDLVKKTLLPIPPVSEQRRLVEAIEKLSSETQHLKNIYEQKLTSLNELKQSILQQAFSGKLTSAVDER